MKFVILFNESIDAFVPQRFKDDFNISRSSFVLDNVRRTVGFDGRYNANPLYAYTFVDSDNGLMLGKTHKEADRLNNMIKEGEVTVRRCIQCNHKFVTLKDTDKWYLSKGMSVPKRCCVCRDKNRINRKKS